jgi:hypothetical protein
MAKEMSANRRLIHLLLMIFAFLVIVLPNSFQVFSIIIFCTLAVLMNVSAKQIYDAQLTLFWGLLSIIFLAFILMSDVKPDDKLQLIFKYIISPFLWLTTFCYIRKTYSMEYLIKRLVILAFIGNLSVVVLYVLMSMGYISLVSYIINAPNIDQNSGLGFTLHVYGSLLFFAVALVPSLFFIKNQLFRIIYVSSFIVSALLSGRTALVLFVFIGLSLFLFYIKRFNFKASAILKTFIFVIIIGQIFITQYSKYFNLNLLDYIQSEHLAKIEDSGGQERSTQTKQILNQFAENPFGSGFVSLSIVRNDLKPYNYEVLILSVLMRFGIITFLLICYSIVSNFKYLAFSGLLRTNLGYSFFALGLVGIIVSSFTNPYLESFFFQWMFFGPLVMLKKDIHYISNVPSVH